MLRVVQFKTRKPLDCGCTPAAIHFCIPSSLAQPDTVLANDGIAILEGTLISCFGNCGPTNFCNKVVTYNIQYDDAQLASYDPDTQIASAPLVCGNILGVFCDDCLLSYIDARAARSISVINTPTDGDILVFIDGEWVAQPICLVGSSSIDFQLTGADNECITGNVLISADIGNTIEIRPDGLYSLGNLVSVLDSATLDLNIAGVPQTLTGSVKISADLGNTIVAHADGIFSPGAPIAVADTQTIDLTLAGIAPFQTLSADLRIDSNNLNLAQSGPGGLYVPARDGWIPFNETLTRTNNTHFTIPGDWRDRIFVGTKIKLFNPTLKYFYVTAPSLFALGVTTVEAIAGDDYLLTAGPITDPFFSHSQDLNAGFPFRFNFTAAPTGFSVAPSYRSQFYVEANWLTVTFATSANGTSNSTTFTISLPKVAVTDGGNQWIESIGQATDNSTSIDTAFVQVTSGSATAVLSKSGATPAWTAALGKGANFRITYPIL